MPYAVPVIVLAVVTLVLLLGMLRGWRARSRRHPVPELPALPAAPHEPPIEGVYVASTLAGRPWERVVARGLGTRSAVEIRIVEPGPNDSGGGVLLTRRGARDVFIPGTDLRGVRRASVMIGKVVEADGLVVLTWQVGDTLLDTGLRTRYASERPLLYDRILALLPLRGTGAHPEGRTHD